MNKWIYLVYFTGVVLWQFPILYGVWLAVRSRLKIRRNLKMHTAGVATRSYGPIGEHVRMAIEGASMEGLFAGVDTFFAVSIILFCGATLITSLIEGPGLGLVFGVFMGVMPYCIIMARLYNRRVARSREGDLLVQELLSNYKICSFNMKEAVEATAATIEGAPNAKGLLLNLAKGFNNAVTPEETEKLLSVFRYALDTAWGNVLASNIYFAYIHGVRVDTALEDLLASITKSRQVMEHGKQENNEARLMLKYLAPLSFLLTIFIACRYFGFTFGKFVKYQLGTALGLRWFLLMVMIYVAGVLVNGFFSSEKMDI